MSNPSTWETKEKEPGFEASLSDIVRPCLGNSKTSSSKEKKKLRTLLIFAESPGDYGFVHYSADLQ